MRWVSGIFILSILFSGCGYSWQSKHNPWKEKGVERIFIQMPVNSSQTVGVETTLVGSVIRELSRVPRFKVVSREEDADAILEGVIDSAGSRSSSQAAVSGISKDTRARGIGDMLVSSEYVVYLNASFKLRRTGRDGALLWNDVFSRQKTYPANNRFGGEGNTSSLINASEEQIQMVEVTNAMAIDLNDSLMEYF